MILHDAPLDQSKTIDNLLSFILRRGSLIAIQAIAISPEIQQLLLANPIALTNHFSREAIKAIIYQACTLGHLSLSKCLIDSIQLDVVNEQLANPFGEFFMREDGTYEFLSKRPAIQAAAASNSCDLIQYLLSFYDQSTFDKTSCKGDIQGAMAIACGHDADDVVDYLLVYGVNPNSEFKEKHTTTALHRAVMSGSLCVIQRLVEHGATIGALTQYMAVKTGRLDVVSYFVSKGITFKACGSDISLMTAFLSRSVDMVLYFINTLQFNLYGPDVFTDADKKKREMHIVKRVLRSGSIEVLQFIEAKLNIPVTALLKNELRTATNFHHIHGRSFFFEAVSSYQVGLLTFLFEIKGLVPTEEQLIQLQSYAFDGSSLNLLNEKFLTHVYLSSFFHKELGMRQFYRDVSEIGDVQWLSNEELFILYSDYTKKFNEVPDRLDFVHKCCDHAVYLANEISRRHLNPQELLALATQKNGQLAPAIRFFLIVTGTGFANAALQEALQPKVFNPNVSRDSLGHQNIPVRSKLPLEIPISRSSAGFFESRGRGLVTPNKEDIAGPRYPEGSFI